MKVREAIKVLALSLLGLLDLTGKKVGDRHFENVTASERLWFKCFKIEKPYKWQVELTHNFINGHNTLASIPCSGGKTVGFVMAGVAIATAMRQEFEAKNLVCAIISYELLYKIWMLHVQK